MISGINHVTLSVSDLERSFHFYTDILKLKPAAKWNRGAYLLAGEDWICLSLDRDARSGPLPEYTHFAFTISSKDFDAYAVNLLSRGCKTWKENRSEGNSLYILDPDGHKLEIHAGDLSSRLESLRDKPYEGLVLY